MADRSELSAEGDLMREAEAGTLLGLAPQTMSNRRAQGLGPPYIKLGNRSVRYSRKALIKWLEDNAVYPGAAN